MQRVIKKNSQTKDLKLMRKARKRIKISCSLFISTILHNFLFILLAITHHPNIMPIIRLDNRIKVVCLIIKDILHIIWISHIYLKWHLIILKTRYNILVILCLICLLSRDKIFKCILVMCFITTLCLCIREIVIILRIRPKIFLLVMPCLIMDLSIC